jgi:thiamine pyrophosphokinase
MPRALIFANGEFNHPDITRSLVQPDDVIIAADGGARHALAMGVIPSIIIGDLDSLTTAEVRAFNALDVQILRFPPAKDETDLELALSHALRAGYNPILILGAYGGRLDQSLGNIAMLSSPAALQADVRLEDGLTETFFVTSQAVIHGSAGDTVSFIPWGSPAKAVSTEGLAFPLDKETLFPQRTRSISNQMLAQTASVSLGSGLLLCIHIRNN